MESDQLQYLILMGLCLAITLPLEFLFGACVWRRPRRLLQALVPTVVIFTIWDMIAIARNDWAYNPKYITGWYLPFDLPIEELVFFIVIPICGLLTFEAVRRVLHEPDEVKATFRRFLSGARPDKDH